MDPQALYRKHEEAVSKKINEGQHVRPIGLDDLQSMIQKEHDEDLEYQVKKGLLVPDPAGEWYIGRPKIAIRGICNFLNPVKDNFTFTRLLCAYIPASAFCAWGTQLYLNGTFVDLGDRTNLLLLYGSYAIPGAIVGGTFEYKSFIWGILVALPSILTYGRQLPALPLIAISSMAAEAADQFIYRLIRKVN